MSEANAHRAAIVLAAGKSTRMKSDLPKVLHQLCGRPLLAYVIDALTKAGVGRKVLVVGFGADAVRKVFEDEPGVEFALQAEQKGTGHAAMVCADAMAGYKGPVIVLAGDGPMVRPELLANMLARYEATGAKAFLATALVQDPTGLGRIVRDSSGAFVGIVEHKDATPEQRAIREINPSFYVFDAELLFESLRSVKPNNAQGEYYITDVPGILRQRGEKIVAEAIADEVDMFGVNHRRHLAEAHTLMQQRIQGALMDAGVTIVDPTTTFIDARATIGRDTIVHPFSYISGPATIGERCQIGPYAHIRQNAQFKDESVVAGPNR